MLLASLPCTAGIGLRFPHIETFLSILPSPPLWVELHTENITGTLMHSFVEEIGTHYAISLHGVGLSVGGDTCPNALKRLKHLCDCIKPAAVSEHLAWSSFENTYYNTLLPVPYTLDSLMHISDTIKRIQDAIGYKLLIENPASYGKISSSTMNESVFLNKLIDITGCGLLLDITNMYISAHNLTFCPYTYLQEIMYEHVGELHIAGHRADKNILIDSHNSIISEEVWKLYQYTINNFGPRPTLVEWDYDIPSLDVLLGQAHIAQTYLDHDI